MRGSRRSCESTRAAVAAVRERLIRRRSALDEPQERGVEVGRAGAPQELFRVRDRRGCAPSRRSSSRSHRAASSITWLETSSVVPAAASSWKKSHRSRRRTRVEADRGLVEHEHLRLAEERRRPARRAPAARPRAGRRGGRRASPSPTRSITSSTRAARDAEHPREVGEVLARPRGRRRPTAPASRSRPGGGAQATPAGSPSTRTSSRPRRSERRRSRASASTSRCRSARAGPVTTPRVDARARVRGARSAPPRSTRRPEISIVAATPASNPRRSRLRAVSVPGLLRCRRRARRLARTRRTTRSRPRSSPTRAATGRCSRSCT